MWREESVKCIEVVKGMTILSCLFRSCRGNLEWALIGVYCRGNSQEREMLGRELEECRRKWCKNGMGKGRIST